MKNTIELINGNKKVLISKSHTCDKGKFAYYLTYMFFQPYLSMGWLVDFSKKQTEYISSLKSAKSAASIYLTQSKLSKIESNIYE